MNNSTLDTLEPKHIPSADEGTLTQVPSSQRAEALDAEAHSPIKEAVAKTGEKAREQGNKLLGKAKDLGRERSDEVVNGASSHARNISEATKQTAETLRETEPEFVAAGFDFLSQGVSKVADYFEKNDSRAIAEDGKELIRKHPGAVLGGLAVAGFLAARFLKASEE